jgi:hypothetical protein
MRRRSDPDPADPDPAVPPTHRPISRRSLLTAGAAGAGAVLVGAAIPVLRRDPAGAAAPPSSGGPSPSSTSSVPTTGGAAAPSASPSTTTAGAGGGAGLMGDVASDNLTISVADGYRTITTASLPDRPTDTGYRYVSQPSAQDLSLRVTTNPTVASALTENTTGHRFGIHASGVLFDPATAEHYQDDWDSGWNGEARSVDSWGAHTQNTGFYHYHRITDRWVSSPTEHSTLVGWAADGFPTYLRYGYADPDDPTSGVVELTSSWRLRSGSRPSGGPPGTYDGTWTQDHEYVEGLGTLDRCNGRICVTPEFPDGTYAYFLTSAWPWIPRWMRGTPDPSFGPPAGGQGGPGRGRTGPPSR